MTISAQGHALHMGIAESGKLCAIAGDHNEALRHYREALRLAHSIQAPDVFFRHYIQCVLESLECTGAYGEVIEFCENALRHLEQIEKPLALHLRDRAATLERLAVNLIKAGRLEEARPVLDRAVAEAERGDLPLARAVLDWMRRGMTPLPRRIEQLQAKHGYFTVTQDQVEPARAVPLPNNGGPVANAL